MATLCLLRRHLPFKGVPGGRAERDVSLSKIVFRSAEHRYAKKFAKAFNDRRYGYFSG